MCYCSRDSYCTLACNCAAIGSFFLWCLAVGIVAGMIVGFSFIPAASRTWTLGIVIGVASIGIITAAVFVAMGAGCLCGRAFEEAEKHRKNEKERDAERRRLVPAVATTSLLGTGYSNKREENNEPDDILV